MKQYIPMTTNDLIELLKTADPEGNRAIALDYPLAEDFFEVYQGEIEIELIELYDKKILVIK